MKIYLLLKLRSLLYYQPQGQKDTPRKPLVKSSRPPIDFSDSEREESEYETEGEEDERAPQRRRIDELEEEDEYEEDDHDEEERAANEASDEEPEVCRYFFGTFHPNC